MNKYFTILFFSLVSCLLEFKKKWKCVEMENTFKVLDNFNLYFLFHIPL